MLRVENLRKSFPSEGGMVDAVDGVTFSIASGEFFTLLGPSGCGKSTTLRCVAGLERITSGVIEIDGEFVASQSRHGMRTGARFPWCFSPTRSGRT